MLKGIIEIILFILPMLNILPKKCLSTTVPPIYPEQIHLSLGNCPLQMVVTWVTFTDTRHSFVWFGKVSEGLTHRVQGYSKKFTLRKYSRKSRHVHRVILSDLEPLTFYVYRCGSFFGVSEVFVFKVNPTGTDWSPRLIIFGDMGLKGAVAFPYILDEARDFDVDAIIHVGDIAYNMASYDGSIGDGFLRMIQPLASSVPYMTAVGNHEEYQNFSHYKNVFSMPGDSEGLYYSFDMGPVHFVIISSEVYYFMQYGTEPLINQFQWLQKDLEMAANKRKERPWIIVCIHRPMYCSSDDNEDCSLDQSILRHCYYHSYNYGLEDLFQRYRVDLIFSGHMHYYERSWPIYNKQIYNGSYQEPYRNPGAAVHIITGAGGMKSGTESVTTVRKDYFGFYSNEYSYTILSILNRSLIYLEQVSASRGGQVIDTVCFIKDV